MNAASWSLSVIAAISSKSGINGSAPRLSIRSSSMKLVKASPILRSSSESPSPRAQASMISRTFASTPSASSTNGPHEERSCGISVVSSQLPLTWPNRSSWGRMSGFMPDLASSRIVTGGNLYGPPHARVGA